MYTNENNADGEYIFSKMVLDQVPAGELQEKYESPSSPHFKDVYVVSQPGASRFNFPKNLGEIFLGSETSEFKDLEQITDFSGEPYKVLKAIPVTIRSLDGGGFEAAFVEGNIAWVDDSRIEAVNGLKAEILDAIDLFEANKDRLGLEPRRQLAVLRTHLKHTS